MQRAEHNDGVLATLEEVSLHQLSIEKIDGLGHMCKHLRILYLQSNLISRLENLHKLKVFTKFVMQACNELTLAEPRHVAGTGVFEHGCQQLDKNPEPAAV